MTQRAHNVLVGPICAQSHYAAVVEAVKDVEIYQRGDVDCASCLRRMADKHEQLTKIFRDRLSTLGGAV